MSEVVDTTAGGEVPQIDAKIYTDQYKHYIKVMHVPPKAEEEPSILQMTCLMQLLASVCCYVDFSTWVSHHLRTLKSQKGSGMIPGTPDADGEATLSNRSIMGRRITRIGK